LQLGFKLARIGSNKCMNQEATIGSNKVDVDGSALKEFILLSNKTNFE